MGPTVRAELRGRFAFAFHSRSPKTDFTAGGSFPRPASTNGPRDVQTLTSLCRSQTLMWAALLCTARAVAGRRASAEALLVIEVDTGKVLYAQNAGSPWYPASVTKLMT